MKKIFTLLLILISLGSYAQLLNPGDTTGTLITASIRPNSQADNVATIYTNEARGTIHHYETWAELLAMKSSRLVKYQLATVADSLGKVFQYDGINWIGAIPTPDLSNYFALDQDAEITGYANFSNGFDAAYFWVEEGDFDYLYGGDIQAGIGDFEELHSDNTYLRNNFNIEGLRLYENNVDALAGGLVMGDTYKTTTGKLGIVLYSGDYAPETALDQDISSFDSGSNFQVDFATMQAVKVNLTGNSCWFSLHNVSTAKSRVVSILVTGWGFDCSVSFDQGLLWLGTQPTTIHPSEVGILTFQNFNNQTNEIIASYVQLTPDIVEVVPK